MSTAAALGGTPLSPPTSHEDALHDYALRLVHHTQGRRAVHVRLSLLSPGNRLEHHVRIVMNTFEPLLRRFNGQLFRMWNNDLIVGVKDARIPDIDDTIIKLKFLFSDDPLLSGAGPLHDASNELRFCQWYDMERDYPAFASLSQSFSTAAAQHRQAMAQKALSEKNSAHQTSETPGVLSALTPALLDRLESALSVTDLGPMVERQMIFSLPVNGQPRPVLCEHFISIHALQNRLLKGVDFLGNRWLFQHLCQILDIRMLAAMPDFAKNVSAPITINVNVGTILSAEFLKFDAAIRRITQQTIILELQSVDLFADMGAYIFARDFAHERGYGIALDGLNHLTFPLIDRAKLKLDFEKIIWNPEIILDFSATRRAAFIDAIQLAGANRIILCRCDSQDAVDFGRDVGLSLFQGRHLDRMLAGG